MYRFLDFLCAHPVWCHILHSCFLIVTILIFVRVLFVWTILTFFSFLNIIFTYITFVIHLNIIILLKIIFIIIIYLIVFTFIFFVWIIFAVIISAIIFCLFIIGLSQRNTYSLKKFFLVVEFPDWWHIRFLDEFILLNLSCYHLFSPVVT